jgi:hypothetical protein
MKNYILGACSILLTAQAAVAKNGINASFKVNASEINVLILDAAASSGCNLIESPLIPIAVSAPYLEEPVSTEIQVKTPFYSCVTAVPVKVTINSPSLQLKDAVFEGSYMIKRRILTEGRMAVLGGPEGMKRADIAGLQRFLVNTNGGCLGDEVMFSQVAGKISFNSMTGVSGQARCAAEALAIGADQIYSAAESRVARLGNGAVQLASQLGNQIYDIGSEINSYRKSAQKQVALALKATGSALNNASRKIDTN